MNISSIPLSGLRAATVRLTANASNIANAMSEDYTPVRAVQSDVAGGGTVARIETSGAESVDLTDEMVGALTAKIAFQANAKMLDSIHKIDRRLLEALA